MFLILLFVPVCWGKIYADTLTDFSECSTHYSGPNNSYKDYYEISDESRLGDTALLDFHFSVLGASDAHILLAPIAHPNKTDPVYEIVLGAGGNSFSDIRRAQKAEVRSSVRHTDGILSALDVHSFWIHISKNGLIEVGKEGEQIPFIDWSDPSPLPVHFFSFGTWAGGEAKWFFYCPLGNAVEDKKPLTDLQHLREDLLKSYDPSLRPVLNHTNFTTVIIKMVLNRINLDEHKSALNSEGKIYLSWTDEKIKWNPTLYGNITSLHLPEKLIWKPHLELFNGVDLIGDHFTMNNILTINHNGSVKWTCPVSIQVWCKARELGHWPSDTHHCKILLGFWDNSLRLNFDDDSEIRTQPNEQWELLQVTSLSDFNLTTFIETSQIGGTLLKLTFKLRRNSSFPEVVFFAPFIVVAMSMLATFWMSPFGSLKIFLGCLQLIVETLVLINLGEIIPLYLNKIPYIVLLYILSLFASLVCIFISIVVINLSRRRHKNSIPHCVAQTLMLTVVQTCLMLPQIKMTKQYGKIENTEPTKIDENIQNGWIMLAKVVDRISFVVFFVFVLTIISKL